MTPEEGCEARRSEWGRVRTMMKLALDRIERALKPRLVFQITPATAQIPCASQDYNRWTD